MLLYPDGRIQAAGAYRNLGAPEWFDHRYRFKRPDYGPANVADVTLAVTGAAMYLRRSLIDEVGDFDDALSDGLRGRRLLPTRLGGRLAGPVRAQRPA